MLLNVKNLTVKVARTGQILVNQVNFDLNAKEVVAIVGGSGSGKTTTAMSIVRLLDPSLEITGGSISFNGNNLAAFNNQQMRHIRGRDIAVVFQEPLYAFNPVFTIGYQINEVLVYHTDLSRRQRQTRIPELLDIVGISDPQRVKNHYPHQLSGGMRQRAMIAQAIAADPRLIIADEPTSSLDVTLQARIIELFQKLKEELSLSILLITHDLGVVGHLSDRVAVMTGGGIVEFGPAAQVLKTPKAEYTLELMEALKF